MQWGHVAYLKVVDVYCEVLDAHFGQLVCVAALYGRTFKSGAGTHLGDSALNMTFRSCLFSAFSSFACVWCKIVSVHGISIPVTCECVLE